MNRTDWLFVFGALALVLSSQAHGAPSFAPQQGTSSAPGFCYARDPGDPTYDITDYDPSRDSDDWCKLAYHEPFRARRQLAKAVAMVRSRNNPNRFYFDQKTGAPDGLYIQLLRPWMREENDAGSKWRVYQYEDTWSESSIPSVVSLSNQPWLHILINDSVGQRTIRLIIKTHIAVQTYPRLRLTYPELGLLFYQLVQAISSNGDECPAGKYSLRPNQIKMRVEDVLDFMGGARLQHENPHDGWECTRA